STVISGTPLRDGYHFGQTIINDYGRPYGEGFNNVSGVTAHAVAGPLSISIQGEYQHAPGRHPKILRRRCRRLAQWMERRPTRLPFRQSAAYACSMRPLP